MKHYLLLLSCKNTDAILVSNAGFITSEILYIFLNVDRINQWYSSKNETSLHFKVIRPNKYFQNPYRKQDKWFNLKH